MERLWAPWRIKYITSELESCECFLCEKQKEPENDDTNLVLHRGVNCYVLLNTYPYNNGHLMIAPYRHVGEFQKLTDDEMLEIMQFTRLSVDAIEKALGAQGFNIGFNLGVCAGAGCADHIHLHIVPRWGGDTNFMPVLADNKIISEALESTYEKLLPYFRDLI